VTEITILHHVCAKFALQMHLLVPASRRLNKCRREFTSTNKVPINNLFAVNIRQRIDAILVRNSKLKPLTLFETRKGIAKKKVSVKQATPVLQKARIFFLQTCSTTHAFCCVRSSDEEKSRIPRSFRVQN